MLIKIKNTTTSLLLIAAFLVHLIPVPVSALSDINAVMSLTINSEVLISEAQTGSLSSASEEFVELYNNSEETIDLSGWRLEYKSATGTSWTSKAVLSGLVDPGDFHIVATAGYLASESDGTFSSGLAASGGHIRLVVPGDTEDTVLDLVGWGSADSAEGNSPANAPVAGGSLQRCATDGVVTDTNNNSVDYIDQEIITPRAVANCDIEIPPEDEEEPPVDIPTCDGVVFSEILPNPISSDTGNEFIELVNPTDDFVPLKDCSLQVGGNSKLYVFGEIELEPGEYKAFYDIQTGLVLPNSAGGTVYLLSPAKVELSNVTYPGGLADDVAWAWFGGNHWEATYKLTPNFENIQQATKPCSEGQVRNPETGRCISDSGDETSLQPCAPDQERNPETNRCRKITTSSLVPCGPGQERNPATNRCRSVLSSVRQLVPCKAGQERNPATNRCRKIAGSDLQPCKPGQERNPETNRCRKVSGVIEGDVAGIQDIKDNTKFNKNNLLLAGSAGFLALGYGAWEWRNELWKLVQKFKK